jgi:hypothetical protein
MKKIPSVFKRVFNGSNSALAYDEVTNGCEWVIEGQGTPTLKWDGQATMVRDGVLYRRYDRKLKDRALLKRVQAGEVAASSLSESDFKTPPENWEPCEPTWDSTTAHWPGWARVQDCPADKYLWSTYQEQGPLPDGTYEFVGETVGGNKHYITGHLFVNHVEQGIGAPHTFDELKIWFQDHIMEGIVWHHPDGRMAKLHRTAMGYNW